MAFRKIIRALGILYGHWVHFVFIWYIYTVLVWSTKENLATLLKTVLLHAHKKAFSSKWKVVQYPAARIEFRFFCNNCGFILLSNIVVATYIAKSNSQSTFIRHLIVHFFNFSVLIFKCWARGFLHFYSKCVHTYIQCIPNDYFSFFLPYICLKTFNYAHIIYNQ
jgi:hypothetical protein